MNTEEYTLLYEKYIAGKCTPEEKEKLFSYKDDFRMQDVDPNNNPAEEARRDRILKNIQQSIKPTRTTILPIYWRWSAAAVLLISLSLLLLLVKKEPLKTEVAIASPILPGTNTAILTLADKSTIALDQIANSVTLSGNTRITKLKNGEVSYQSNTASATTKPTENTITIPKGGQYHITLQDGTRVWLNAGSSLTFPTFFAGTERRVRLTGEAYFEVAKNIKMPFKVTAKDAEIEVLGTHFNITAYEDESSTKTTLIEGAVRLSNSKNKVVLKPDQQGLIVQNSDRIAVKPVHGSDAAAWKSGLFIFRDDQITDIMKQISRWYNVDVEYRGNMTNKTFGGVYSKNKNLTELLKGLELTGLIHFKVEGRRIIVMQ